MVWMPVVTLERENNYEANLQTGDAPHGRDGEEFHLDCLVTILRSTFSDYYTHPSHTCKVWFNAVQQIQTDEVD